MLKTIESTTQLKGNLNLIYQRQQGRCNHVGCKVRGIHNLTKDHIIPISVAKFYGLPRSFYESIHNKQLLCPDHHIFKDRKNNIRLDNMRRRKELLLKINEIRYALTGRN